MCRGRLYLGFMFILFWFGSVFADQTIIVDGQDQSIKYNVTDGDNGATWTLVQRSDDTCDTAQMLTSRLGDFMTFTFTGTAVFVIGTVGVKQGIINFNLDGQNMTNFNRGRSLLICDFVLFQALNLPYQQHTVVATLVQRGLNLQTGQMDGVLSVQRIRYNIPGGSGKPVGAIIGGVVAVLALIAAAGLSYYFWRKRHPKRWIPATFWDKDDDINGSGKQIVNPGLVATPFEWDGPPKPGNNDGFYGGVEAEQAPGPNSNSNTNSSSNTNSHQNQLGATQTSSGSGGGRRESGLTGSTLVTSNPDPGRGDKSGGTYALEPMSSRRYEGGPGGPAGPSAIAVQPPPRPSSGPIDETQLVDRIAHRLADIMTERVGVGSDAPPSYIGEDGQFYAIPPPPPPPPPPAARQSSTGPSYPPPPPSRASKSPSSPQIILSPPPSSQQQPPTPPGGSSSFGGNPTRFGPRPRPSGSGGGRP